MRVIELWRYPVKSLQGERVDAAALTAGGLDGDRRWALVDAATGAVLTARKVPQLLFAAARCRPDGGVEVVLPDGTVTDDDAVLTGFCGRPVLLRGAGDGAGRGAEGGAAVPFHDEELAAVTLLSTGTLARAAEGAAWDPRRFRSNVLLQGDGEEELVGGRAALGDALLDVALAVPRCVMTTRPQAGGIGRDTGVLHAIHRRGGVLAVGALVVRAGRVAVGDDLGAAG